MCITWDKVTALLFAQAVNVLEAANDKIEIFLRCCFQRSNLFCKQKEKITCPKENISPSPLPHPLISKSPKLFFL